MIIHSLSQWALSVLTLFSICCMWPSSPSTPFTPTINIPPLPWLLLSSLFCKLLSLPTPLIVVGLQHFQTLHIFPRWPHPQIPPMCSWFPKSYLQLRPPWSLYLYIKLFPFWCLTGISNWIKQFQTSYPLTTSNQYLPFIPPATALVQEVNTSLLVYSNRIFPCTTCLQRAPSFAPVEQSY